MRLFWRYFDKLRYAIVGDRGKAWNYGYIKLARPGEVVNVELGMTVSYINRATGSIRFKEQAKSYKEVLACRKKALSEVGKAGHKRGKNEGT
jgi:hypothetical protein